MTDQTQSEEALVRRAPKYGAFIVVGALVAALVTLIATAQFPVDPNVGFGASFGYFCLFTVPAGVVVGSLVALALDRSSRKRAKSVTVARETTEVAE